MKLNIAYPASGAQKGVEIDDDKKIRQFYDKQISQEVSGDILGDQWKGYIFKIMGGNDKQGFPMMQGVLTNTRVRLLLGAKHQCFRERRDGSRIRKSVRGCIVGPDISALHLVVVKKGPEEIPGLTAKNVPNRLGPKRASKIRRLFNLSKKDDVRKYVIRRSIPAKEGKKVQKAKSKAPKIQRLVTPRTLRHKREIMAEKRYRRTHTKELAAEYAKLVAQRAKDERASKRSHRSSSKKEDEHTKAPTTTKPTDTKTTTTKPTDTKTTTKTAKPTDTKTTKTAKPTDTKTTTKAAPAKTAAPAKQEPAKTAAPAKQEPAKTAAPAKQPAKQEPAKTAAPAKQEPAKTAAPAKQEPAKTSTEKKQPPKKK